MPTKISAGQARLLVESLCRDREIDYKTEKVYPLSRYCTLPLPEAIKPAVLIV